MYQLTWVKRKAIQVHGLLSASQIILTNQTYDFEYYFFIGFPPE